MFYLYLDPYYFCSSIQQPDLQLFTCYYHSQIYYRTPTMWYLQHSFHHQIFKSLICNKKDVEPSKVPLGTPSLRLFQLDVFELILIHCCLSYRKFVIQLIRKSGTPVLACFDSKILWSILSNAFLKSSMRTLTTMSVFSMAVSQLWFRHARAITVKLPLRDPNLWGSNRPSIIFITHSLAYHSTPFERAGVSKMGLKSFSTLKDGLTLGSEHTSADFQIWGKKLSLKLEFHMAQIGEAKLNASFHSNKLGMESAF